MEIRNFNQIQKKTINNYIELLKIDLKENPQFSKMASLLFFSPIDDEILEKWVYGLYDVETFQEYFKNLIPRPTHTTKVVDLKKTDWKFVYFKESEIDYTNRNIFTSIKSKERQSLDNYFRKEYFVVNENFINVLDSLIKPFLVDYSYSGNKMIKKVNDRVNIYFNFDTQRPELLPGFCSYLFPTLGISYEGDDFEFSTDTDTCLFLFRGIPSFIAYFYTISTKQKDTGNPKIYDIERKYDEPILYYDEYKFLYELTNKEESIYLFNKFIYINVELFLHYFRVFEKWLIETFIPAINETF